MSAELWAATALFYLGSGLLIGWYARMAWANGWRLTWPVRRKSEAE